MSATHKTKQQPHRGDGDDGGQHLMKLKTTLRPEADPAKLMTQVMSVLGVGKVLERFHSILRSPQPSHRPHLDLPGAEEPPAHKHTRAHPQWSGSSLI